MMVINMIKTIKKNPVGFISISMLLISFLGSVSLFSYSHYYNLPFYKLIQPQIITAIGVLHAIIIIISFIFLSYALFIIHYSYKIMFSVAPSIKPLFIEEKGLFLVIALFPLLSLLSMIYIDFNIYLIMTFSFLPTPLYYIFAKKTTEKLKSLLAMLLFFSIPPIFYIVICLLFSDINKIELSTPLGLFLSSGYFLSIIFLLENTIDKKKLNENMTYLLFIAFFIIISIILSGRGSDRAINMIGAGFNERCYFTDEINKFRIPEKYITHKSNKISSIFVLSDISNKISVGYESDKKISFVYSFKYEKINQMSCEDYN